jgi:O-antigen ligase
MMVSKRLQKLLYIAISFFAFFPFLPNRMKGFPVIFLFLMAIIVFIKERKYQYPFKKVIFFSSLYIIYIISLLYTENFDKIDRTLSTRLSLLIVPISFGLIASTVKKIKTKYFLFFIKLSITVVMLYSLAIIFYLYTLGVFSGQMSLNDSMSYLSNRMWGIGQHPIYASLFIGISVIFAGIMFTKEKNKSNTFFFLLALLIQLMTLFILARKGVLIALLLSILSVFFFLIKKTYLQKHFFKIVVLSGLLFFVSTQVKIRFSEVFKKTTYTSVSEGNSTSIRVGIYGCVLEKIKESPIIGHGIGDVKDVLKICYKQRSDILHRNEYNSHNQYLSYFLSSGVFGFLLLIFLIVKTSVDAIKKKNTLLLLITVFFAISMLFENILERQSGVILFSFYICLFSFYNFSNNEKNIDEKGN